MMAKIINKELSNFDKSYKIKSLNFDKVVVKENNETFSFNMSDIEIICENKNEELISRHKDILKIKLNSSVSMMLYVALINCIGEKVNGIIEDIEVLRDDFKINKRGIWEKRIVAVVNNAIPLDINIIGTKYGREFNITFKDITLQNFIDGCSEDMRNLKRELEEKGRAIERYKKALEGVLVNRIEADSTEHRKLVSGM